MKRVPISVSLLAIIASGCLAAPPPRSDVPAPTYTLPDAIFSKHFQDPFEPISAQEWTTLTEQVGDLRFREKQQVLIQMASDLINRSAELLSGDVQSRAVGQRLAFKALLLTYVTSDFDVSEQTATIPTDSVSSPAQKLKDSVLSVGLTEISFHDSLLNLVRNLQLAELTRRYEDRRRWALLSAIENRPTTPSSTALLQILEAGVAGQSFANFWCEQYKDSRSELFSPRSYRVLGVSTADSYVRGAYRNNYKVMIESSSRGGAPIVKTWTLFLQWGELFSRKNDVGWCLVAIIE